MGIRFTTSADRHGIAHEDAIYAMIHSTGTESVASAKSLPTRVFVGHPHLQTERYIEVIASVLGADIVIFVKPRVL